MQLLKPERPRGDALQQKPADCPATRGKNKSKPRQQQDPAQPKINLKKFFFFFFSKEEFGGRMVPFSISDQKRFVNIGTMIKTYIKIQESAM